MKIKRQYASKLVCLFMCVTVCAFGQMLSVAICQQADQPVTRKILKRSFEAGRKEKIPAESYVDLIKRIGVDFLLTPRIEKEIRSEGKYLGTKGLDDLVEAIRNNYRPEPIEPTEDEMRRALISSMLDAGGQLIDDRTVEFKFLFAGMSIKIEKFEKLEGCKPANYGAGYTCTYKLTTSQALHSYEGTEDGEKHRQALQWLMEKILGKYANGKANRSFARSKEGWVMLN